MQAPFIMSGCVFVLLLATAQFSLSQGDEICGSERCEPVVKKGVRTPQYCGMERRCEPCGAYACHLDKIPPPCHLFCTQKAYETTKIPIAHDNNKTITKPDDKHQHVSCEAGPASHTSIIVPILTICLAFSLILNIVQSRAGLQSLLYSCAWRPQPRVGDHPNFHNVFYQKCPACQEVAERTELKMPLVGGTLTGSQLSLVSISHKSCESLRHALAHPEEERNASLA